MEVYAPLMNGVLLELTLAPVTTLSAFTESAARNASLFDHHTAIVRLDLYHIWVIGFSPFVSELLYFLVMPASLRRLNALNDKRNYRRMRIPKAAASGHLYTTALPLCGYLTLAVFLPMIVGRIVDFIPAWCLCPECGGDLEGNSWEGIVCAARNSRDWWWMWERLGSERIHATLTLAFLAARFLFFMGRMIERVREWERDRLYLAGRVVVNRVDVEETERNDIGGH